MPSRMQNIVRSGTTTPQSTTGITIHLHAEIQTSNKMHVYVHVYHCMSYYYLYHWFSNIPGGGDCSMLPARGRAHDSCISLPFPFLPIYLSLLFHPRKLVVLYVSCGFSFTNSQYLCGSLKNACQIWLLFKKITPEKAERRAMNLKRTSDPIQSLHWFVKLARREEKSRV